MGACHTCVSSKTVQPIWTAQDPDEHTVCTKLHLCAWSIHAQVRAHWHLYRAGRTCICGLLNGLQQWIVARVKGQSEGAVYDVAIDLCSKVCTAQTHISQYSPQCR